MISNNKSKHAIRRALVDERKKCYFGRDRLLITSFLQSKHVVPKQPQLHLHLALVSRTNNVT